MPDDALLRKLMLYFRPGVLAMFHNESDKYAIQTDEFEGSVRIRDSYSGAADECYLSVEFGFRACKNGEWAVAAWGPDLAKATEGERILWIGFQLDQDAVVPERDPRFQKWVERYIN